MDNQNRRWIEYQRLRVCIAFCAQIKSMLAGLHNKKADQLAGFGETPRAQILNRSIVIMRNNVVEMGVTFSNFGSSISGSWDKGLLPLL